MKLTKKIGLGIVALGLAGVLVLSGSKRKDIVDKEVDKMNLTTIKDPKAGKLSDVKKKIKVIELNPFNTILLFDQIDGNSINRALGQLRDLNDYTDDNSPIYLVIDSPGGSVIDGGRLVSAMEASRRTVNTVCYTLCASMGAMIHSYGKTRMSFDRSVLMYHNASGGVMGDLPMMLSQLRLLERYVQRMEQNVIRKSSLSLEEYKTLADKQLWVDAEDALSLGLTDQLVYLSGFEKQLSESAELRAKARKKIQFDLHD